MHGIRAGGFGTVGKASAFRRSEWRGVKYYSTVTLMHDITLSMQHGGTTVAVMGKTRAPVHPK